MATTERIDVDGLQAVSDRGIRIVGRSWPRCFRPPDRILPIDSALEREIDLMGRWWWNRVAKQAMMDDARDRAAQLRRRQRAIQRAPDARPGRPLRPRPR